MSRLCLSTVLPSSHPWSLCEYSPISVSFSWVLGLVACPSCSVWPFHNSKSVFWPSHWISQGNKNELSTYNLWPCPSMLVVSSATIAWVAVKCYAMRFLSCPKYTFVSCVSSWVTESVNSDVKTLVFLWYVLFEKDPSFVQNNNLSHGRIFRIVEFGTCNI
jgi:hypothetical protein